MEGTRTTLAALFILLLSFCLLSVKQVAAVEADYCIIGAGPGGLQVGYFLQQAGREYVIFEKNSSAGSFFGHYPRHRKLVSINKRNTGNVNKEFNFRHDWNSLISDDESLQMKHYSREYFPHADDYVRYLKDFANKLSLKIVYNTEIVDISRPSQYFHLKEKNSNIHLCRVVIASTGMWVPNIPSDILGVELAMGYESMSIDPEVYEGKAVLILGRGNSGFETADHIVSHTAYIHMSGRSRLKFAYQTHYVGDVRAVNAQQLDTYQLKSLDGQWIEGDLASGIGFEQGEDGKIHIIVPGYIDDQDQQLALHPYDVIIRCLGFKFDFFIFNTTLPVGVSKEKYPTIKANYETIGVKDLYIAGVATHSLDYRKSAGGFIHGFRYTAKALFNHLEWKYHGVPWPSVTLPSIDLLNHMIRRINEASGPYQMFGVLVDIILIKNKDSVVYLEEVPLQSLPMFKEMTGHDIEKFIVWDFEYGKGFSGPGNDVLHEDRAVGDPFEADKCNFLHPVVYYYSKPPQQIEEWEKGQFPKSDLYLHIVEDFFTDWTSQTRHIIPLRRFLEEVLQADLRNFLAEMCFEMIFTHGTDIPLACQQHYMKGHGIVSVDENLNFGPAEIYIEFEDWMRRQISNTVLTNI